MSTTVVATKSLLTSPQDESFDTILRRTSTIAAMLLHHPATELFLELSTLPSGYSTDVHAQLSISRFVKKSGPSNTTMKGNAYPPQIVFLSIGNDSNIRCHTRG